MPTRSILWRIILYFTLASFAVSVLVALATIAWSYQQQTQAYQDKLDNIKSGYLMSLGASLWFYDEAQLRSQIKGILNLGDIAYLHVADNLNLSVEEGERPHISQIKSIPIIFEQKKVGVLELAFDQDSVIQKATLNAMTTFFAQLLSLVLLAVLLGIIVHRFINKRIRALAEEVEAHRQYAIFKPLSVPTSTSNDEIDVLLKAFNALSAQMNDELKQKTFAQQQLKIINLELEDRVIERTLNLQKTVDELHQTLEQLHNTQGKLIEAEKLSSLGGMVAGIAHEINTPLGLCITMQSFLQDNYQATKTKFDAGKIQKQEFNDFLAVLDESLSILDKNLQRAAQLIKSFKQVSEDQTGEHIRKVMLLDYLHEILETLSPKFKKTQHKVVINCPETLWAQTYAGAISQVFTNLIMNALLHAFEHQEAGTIHIEIGEDKGLIIVHFNDDGVGLSAEGKQKIFEPFYTTKRGQGGTGLGMHLVYSIVHQRLKGEIQLEEVPVGTGFVLRFPQILADEDAL
jgi:signal transduction histidine kinase